MCACTRMAGVRTSLHTKGVLTAQILPLRPRRQRRDTASERLESSARERSFFGIIAFEC